MHRNGQYSNDFALGLHTCLCGEEIAFLVVFINRNDQDPVCQRQQLNREKLKYSPSTDKTGRFPLSLPTITRTSCNNDDQRKKMPRTRDIWSPARKLTMSPYQVHNGNNRRSLFIKLKNRQVIIFSRLHGSQMVLNKSVTLIPKSILK